MVAGTVVQHEIHDDADVVFSCVAGQAMKVFERSVHGIDVSIIRNVVAKIELRRRKTRGNPNGVDAKAFQIIQLGRNAVEVTDAIIVAIGEAARIDFVEHCVLPPLVSFGVRRRRLRKDGNTRQAEGSD